MRIFAAGFLLGLCCLPMCGVAAQTESGAATTETVPDPMAPIAWLAGDWHSSSPTPTPSDPKRLNKAGIRFRSALAGKLLTLSMAVDGHDLMQGMFAYDGSKKTIAFWYVIADPEDPLSEEDGSLAQGIVKSESGSLLLDYTVTRRDGATGQLQTRIERLDSEHFRWGVFVDYPGEGMQKLSEMVFSRGL